MRLVLLTAAALACTAAPAAAQADLTQVVSAFLNSYADGDKAAVIAAVEPNVHLYGSDLSQTYNGVEGAGDMFDKDMRLWGGSAKFGTMWHVTGVREGNLESIMFDIPFTAGRNPTVTVRYAMVWHLEGDTWKLAQSSNSVPTTGQGAGDAVKHAH
ncbi:MAG TPA: nuclear transport factor 2 family protein [Rhizomicrobium sp.]|nr:nuclear transport factor 2 family protein [Rhizomicrobium sp.]